MSVVPDEFASASVHSPSGESVTVSELWWEKTAVIALVRHFG